MIKRIVRRLRHHFGIAAPRMTVRTHVGWHWRALGMVAMLSVSFAVAMWIYDAGRRFAGFDALSLETELTAVRARTAELEKEVERLRATALTSESTLSMERAAQQQLVRQVKQIEAENARLREDVAFFENLSARDRARDKLTIQGFKVENDVMPGEYRYRLLLVQGARDKEFVGRLELVVATRQGGRDVTITLPQDPRQAATATLRFKRFLRAEGTFRIDPEIEVVSVQARVLDEGAKEPRATQSVVL